MHILQIIQRKEYPEEVIHISVDNGCPTALIGTNKVSSMAVPYLRVWQRSANFFVFAAWVLLGN